MKKILIILTCIAFALAGAIYYFRYDIVHYSLETIIENNLPPYMTIGSIKIDFQNEIFTINNLRIKNPHGYAKKLLVEINSVKCRYKRISGNLFDGVEITEITTERPVINIERAPNGNVNVARMNAVIDPPKPVKIIQSVPRLKEKILALLPRFKGNVSDVVKLPEGINISNGKIVFLDRINPNLLTRITCEDIKAFLKINLTKDYSKVLFLASQGNGLVNGDLSQGITWDISLDPVSEKIKMSNTYEIRNIDMTLFESYYEKFCPIVIDRARCSGTIVLNFDGEDIGSTNTLKIDGLRFHEKSEGPAFNYWQIGIPDLIKYLQVSTGEIIFDFKIKGNINNPKFYPGPYLKKAMQSLVVNKVTDAISSFTDEKMGDNSDVGKVINTIRGLLNK
ncbi:MAG: DUF748 domain-containing protein [Candidatus Omnitrophota bacterium]|nr:DUF748 domain-containing protein [Candidatus Omnitrophota bacterium]MBU1894415.1 DUF748 domain-containing protein [Candidatus Omnitrophota bacterium]